MVGETVVTTLDEQGEPHSAAMGVVWGEETIIIRPYTNTRTFRHLRKRGEAVVNVTDDVLLFAKSALTHERLECEPARASTGWSSAAPATGARSRCARSPSRRRRRAPPAPT